MEERLQKLMSHAGMGSRRDCEAIIAAGRVTVNGRIASLGMKADLELDRVLVDGKPLKPPEKLVYVALYKPRGVISAAEAEDTRPTVRDLVELPGHLYPVGRLDVDSEGLILLTNDGDLTNRLTHPRYGHEKEYRVLVARRPDDEQLATWRRGVVLEDGYRTAPAEVRVEEHYGKGAWLRVTLREGRKRQIRAMGSLTGLPVVKIIRLRMGSVYLGNLKPREWRLLTPQEVASLKTDPPPRRPAGRTDKEAARKPAAAAHGGEPHSPEGRPPRPSRPVSGRKPAGRTSEGWAPPNTSLPKHRGTGHPGSESAYHSTGGGHGRPASGKSGGRPPSGGKPPAGGRPPSGGKPPAGGRPPSGGKPPSSGSKPGSRPPPRRSNPNKH